MKIETTRFGHVEYVEDQVIHFTDGMVGFPRLKNYVLVESPSMPLILWLQSVESADIAFPIIEPWFFRRDYKAPLGDADKISLAHDENDRLKIFTVLTIPDDMTRMTVNLRAPVVINVSKSTAAQMILQDKSLEIRTPAHEGFNKAMSSFLQTRTVSVPEASTDAWVAVDFKGALSTGL